MGVTLTFLGAAGTVTGSQFLISVSDRRYLIDCGLFQGRDVEDLNWQRRIGVDVTAVVLSHAHLDHSGYVPRLVRDGYAGPVYASAATNALLGLLLPDAGQLEEEQAEYANRLGYTRHRPALPLFTADDAVRSLQSLRPLPYDHLTAIDDRLAVTLRPAGHILGSATVECEISDGAGRVSIVFSGDLGRYGQPVMTDPAPVTSADYLVIESTYGDRRHDSQDIEQQLLEAVSRVERDDGVLIIPAFAVGRAQELLYFLGKLREHGRMSDIPVYLDSPMAVDATSLYARFAGDPNLRGTFPPRRRRGRHAERLAVHVVRARQESERLARRRGPCVVISASGMCEGGRVVHHLKTRLSDRRNTVLLVGYQAEGTRGRQLLEGADEVRIHGAQIPVRAQIETIAGLSAHADMADLDRWTSNLQQPPLRTFVVHGESSASQAFAAHLSRRAGWQVTCPAIGEEQPLRLS
jgi:metallo-beta-lactamase family protein